MGRIETRLKELGLVLPAPLQVPAGTRLPFAFVRVSGDRASISGHGPQEPDGSLSKPLGKVGTEVSLDHSAELAGKTALSILGSLERALGDLDRIVAWNRALGMVNAAPGFTRTPDVINGFSDLILDVFGDEVGQHARSAIGVAELPFSLAVEIEADVTIRA